MDRDQEQLAERHPATDSVVLPGDARAKRNMDPFAILRAAVFASSVAGAVEACPSAFVLPSQYKPGVVNGM